MGNFFSQSQESQESVTAYRNFLRLYSRQHSEMMRKDAFLNAARVWGTFSQAQRMRYAQLSCPISDMLMIEHKPAVSRKAKPAKKRQRKVIKKSKPKVKRSLKCEEMDAYQPHPDISMPSIGVVSIPAIADKPMPRVRTFKPKTLAVQNKTKVKRSPKPRICDEIADFRPQPVFGMNSSSAISIRSTAISIPSIAAERRSRIKAVKQNMLSTIAFRNFLDLYLEIDR
ncbi:uncharacterized protein LOC108052246 [Drosophila rhopaloa]|uniref:Uncharacterized protein n=1 Tax=Drosophila rhopaloa TaxID=1041015 RepID=A0ABM5I4S0_DRORH|nr:uncharacterized protein LOC108052246 [Drosophila rhopaloa]